MNKECKCNGSGIIFHQDGFSEYCICYRIKRADELFKRSGANSQYKIFINDLKENPVIISEKRKKQMDELEKSGVVDQWIKEKRITLEEYEIIKNQSTPFLKEVLKQFDDVRTNKSIDQFIDQGMKIYFHGSTGTGKTMAASALMYQGNLRDKKSYFLSMHKIKKLFRYDFYDEDVKREVARQFKLIEESEILILDDLYKEVEQLNLKKENDVTLLKEIHTFLDGTLRDKNRLIIMTSNVPKEQAHENYKRIDLRLSSILFEGKLMDYRFLKKLRKQEQVEFDFELL